MSYLDGLNESQRQTVEHVAGPLMVLAGAGSGKTRALVMRITHLLQEIRVSSFRILALTFSNKAAREMRERVASTLDIDVGALRITTFHSFCANVLRSEATHLGLSRNFTIYDESESKSVVKGILQKEGINSKELSPFEVLYYIDDLKNRGHYPGRADALGHKDDDFYSYFLSYEAELHRSNAIDFGGLITAVLQLFEKFPEVLKVYQNRFQYVLVDEYQDTNRAQFELIKMICEHHRNICVVGDEDQSIYSWRGADIRNILDFEKFFPEAKLIKLEQNYRSSKNIIEAASCVIANNELRKGKQMWTQNPKGASIEIIECESDRSEAEFIAREIARIGNQNIHYEDIAVFYRTNSQSRLIEDNLRRYKIPYRVVGGVRFYDRKEIKDMLAYLRLIVNDKDSLALGRIINVPMRGIGATTLRKLEQEAIRLNCSLWEIIRELEKASSELKVSAKIRAALLQFTALIDETKILNTNKALPSVIYEKILYESGYWDFLKIKKDYESMARLEHLEEFANAIKQYEADAHTPTLLGFLETLTLDASVSEEVLPLEKRNGEVSLMTVHGAKGLEFPYAFIAGSEENVFPSYRSLEESSGIEEERRLFYVAMTRAMEQLYITFAAGRMLFGQLRFNGPSRFIDEIPQKFCHWQKVGESSRQDERWDQYSFSQDTDYEEVVYQVNDNIYSKYRKGFVVKHSLYGKGVVLQSEGSGDQEKVLIKFSDGTVKRFMVEFAPLEIVER